MLPTFGPYGTAWGNIFTSLKLKTKARLLNNGSYLRVFVDLERIIQSDLIYDDVGNYDPEVKRIRVELDSKYGFVDEYAKVVIPLKYEYARFSIAVRPGGSSMVAPSLIQMDEKGGQRGMSATGLSDQL